MLSARHFRVLVFDAIGCFGILNVVDSLLCLEFAPVVLLTIVLGSQKGGMGCNDIIYSPNLVKKKTVYRFKSWCSHIQTTS
jgi:hypothetical protein